MTNEQLYVAIGVPIVFNALIGTLLALWINSSLGNLNKRIDDLRSSTAGRFDDLRSDIAGRSDDLRSNIAGRFDDLRSDMVARFEAVNKRIDALEKLFSRTFEERPRR